MEKNEVKVSVCMITYGQADLISDAISGVLDQECDFELELVICDDCSPDNTQEIISSFSNHPKFNCIKYIRQNQNVGAVANFQISIEACRGNYIAFCEGDDYWIDKHKLQKQIDFMQANPKLVLCFTSRIIEDEHGRRTEAVFPSKKWTKEEIYKDGVVFPLQTILAVNRSKDLVRFLRQFDSSYGGDKLLSYYYTLLGDVESLPDNTAVYRHNGRGIWSKLSPIEKIELHISESLKFYDKIISLNLDSSVDKKTLLNYLHIRVLRTILYNKSDKYKLFLRIFLKEKVSLSVLIYLLKCHLKGKIKRFY